MKRVNYYLPIPLIDCLRKISKKKDISLSEIVRRSLESYVRKEETERWETERREAEQKYAKKTLKT